MPSGLQINKDEEFVPPLALKVQIDTMEVENFQTILLFFLVGMSLVIFKFTLTFTHNSFSCFIASLCTKDHTPSRLL